MLEGKHGHFYFSKGIHFGRKWKNTAVIFLLQNKMKNDSEINGRSYLQELKDILPGVHFFYNLKRADSLQLHSIFGVS